MNYLIKMITGTMLIKNSITAMVMSATPMPNLYSSSTNSPVNRKRIEAMISTMSSFTISNFMSNFDSNGMSDRNRHKYTRLSRSVNCTCKTLKSYREKMMTACRAWRK